MVYVDPYDIQENLNKVDVGVKYDKGKPRLDLIPPEAVFALGVALTYGAGKYEERNWEKGIDPQRIFGALQRHLWKWQNGEDIDPDSGLPHLYHALSNCAFLVSYRDRGLSEKIEYKNPHKV